MDNSKFEGYYILGTKTQKEADKGQGLIIWVQKKPSRLKRFYNKFFLGIRWVDKDIYEEYMNNRTTVDKVKDKANGFKRVVMPKRNSYDKNKERAGTRGGSTTD